MDNKMPGFPPEYSGSVGCRSHQAPPAPHKTSVLEDMAFSGYLSASPIRLASFLEEVIHFSRERQAARSLYV
jgi:hypothetical protein